MTIPEITSKTFTVRFSDCDLHSRLRISNLFRFMEESAIADAEQNGFGIWKMVKHGYTYAISRIKLRIHHTPVWGEKLTISTWTKGYYKDKVALKDYLILDAQGNSIAQGTSSWLLVNLKTGKSENPEMSPFPPPVFPNKEALPQMLDILEPGTNPQVVLEKEARYSDLDMNRHVNNCRYTDWVMDAFSLEELKARPLRSIQINFISQIPYQGKVKIVRFENTNHHALLFGVNSEDPSIIHFQARIGFGA